MILWIDRTIYIDFFLSFLYDRYIMNEGEKKTSRRSFLKIAGTLVLTTAASFLASCKGKGTVAMPEPTLPINQTKSFKEEGIAQENAPPPTEDMKTMVEELKALIPDSNPSLHYIEAGKYDNDKDRNQLDSHFVVFDIGESVEKANQTLKILQRAFTYAIRTNADADVTDSIMTTEQIRRSQDENLSQDFTMEISDRKKEEYVRLGIYGRFTDYETPKFYLLRIWNESQQLRSLDKFYYGNFTQQLTKVTDSPNSIATIDASARMLQ